MEAPSLRALCCRSFSPALISTLPVANQEVPVTPANAGVNERHTIQQSGCPNENEDILQLNHVRSYLDFFQICVFIQPDATWPIWEKEVQDFTKNSPILTLYPEAHWFRKGCKAHRERTTEQKLQCDDAPSCQVRKQERARNR